MQVFVVQQTTGTVSICVLCSGLASPGDPDIYAHWMLLHLSGDCGVFFWRFWCVGVNHGHSLLPCYSETAYCLCWAGCADIHCLSADSFSL